MIAKYRYQEDQAEFLQDFMYPLLNCYPERRVQSQDILRHAWLREPFPENYLMYLALYQGIMRLIKRFAPRSMTSQKKKTRFISMNPSVRMPALKITMKKMVKKIFIRWKKRGISDKLIEASLISATLDMEVGFFWISWTLVQTGSSNPDEKKSEIGLDLKHINLINY